jgi:SAM-dependent methyltransferase
MPRGLPSTSTPSSFDLYEGIAYQDYWDTKDTANFDALEHAIVDELLPPRGDCLLDLGCGHGRLADCYLDRFERVVMFDGSRSLLETAQKTTNGRAGYIWGDINHLPFRGDVFDCVLLVRVFQHLVDSRACVQGVNRVLCQDGRFIFSYLNNRNAHRIMKYILGGIKQSPFATEPQQVNANLFHHHPRYVSGLLNEFGLEILAYRGAGVFNKIVEHAGPLADFVPPGISLAPLLGRSLLAPWLFCQARAKGNGTLSISAEIGSLLVCPGCSSGLARLAGKFECTGCGSIYPVEDGIIDMRLDPPRPTETSL